MLTLVQSVETRWEGDAGNSTVGFLLCIHCYYCIYFLIIASFGKRLNSNTIMCVEHSLRNRLVERDPCHPNKVNMVTGVSSCKARTSFGLFPIE